MRANPCEIAGKQRALDMLRYAGIVVQSDARLAATHEQSGIAIGDKFAEMNGLGRHRGRARSDLR
jgi:hypothetical protein